MTEHRPEQGAEETSEQPSDQQPERPAHRARLAVEPETFPREARPEPGPIAILGTRCGEAVEPAVREAGGELAPLGAATRGLVVLDDVAPERLGEALDAHPRISWVQLPNAGIDALAEVLVPHAERGVLFTSAKGAYAEPVAEHALALALAAMRRLPMRLRADRWGAREGRSLYGADVVIVGAGGIALELLELLAPFRCRTTIVRRSDDPVAGADRTLAVADLDEALATVDVLILAAAATAQTRSLIDAQRLALLPPHAVLVNIARGPLVDTEALADALEQGALYGAGLDVTDPEPLPDGHRLFRSERAIITPHSADTPEMVAPLLAERTRANAEGFLRTGVFVGRCDPRVGY